ncbi:MAG: tetratricopeptide repeat protein [Simkaniaceae bacterium]
MSINEIKRDSFWRFNHEGFQKTVESHCLTGLKQFKKIIRSYIFFHLSFLGLLTAEVTAFFVFLTALFQTSLIAFSLAAILLTGFAYLILLFYFQTKKPEQFLELRNYFMLLCKKGLPKSLLLTEYHLSLANAAYRFAAHLSKEEPHLYQIKPAGLSVNHLIRKFTNICHRKDVQRMKEVLFIVSINEHIQLIKNAPTNLEAHASLANTYVALSRLYQNQENDKFKAAAKKAIQEFHIIDHYSPKDPWVHAQLASCYHDLKMYAEEIQEHETILRLCPEDKQILFRLGILYFQQGHNAQGLQIYEKLQEMQFSRADELIDFYDANIKQEYHITTL